MLNGTDVAELHLDVIFVSSLFSHLLIYGGHRESSLPRNVAAERVKYMFSEGPLLRGPCSKRVFGEK